MSDVAIKIENLSKQYRLGNVGTGTISHDLNRWWANVRGKEDPTLKIGMENKLTESGSDYVYALRDINLEVTQGDILGVIGKNGAGKSTLLKILSRVTTPTTGIIDMYGRVASLLEVGTGFHPELTGRENIYLNGAIMGMTKQEIKNKFDEIVDFAGVEKYIDTPVKRYSSGMYVRLAFAVAAHLEPEILIVDEVLAVGDAEFQKKAIGKMQDVSKGEGRTVLFVSHNMTAVKSLCTKGVVLENGSISYSGNIDPAVDFYLRDHDIKTDSIIMDSIQLMSKEIKIKNVSINNSQASIVNLAYPNRTIKIQIDGTTLNRMKVGIEFLLFDSNEILLGKYAPVLKSGEATQVETGDFSIVEEIHLPHNITNGEYFLQIDITHPNVEFLARFPKGVKLITKDFVSITGISFDYNSYGLLLI